METFSFAKWMCTRLLYPNIPRNTTVFAKVFIFVIACNTVAAVLFKKHIPAFAGEHIGFAKQTYRRRSGDIDLARQKYRNRSS